MSASAIPCIRIATITDLSVLNNTLTSSENKFREFYLATSERVWGINVRTQDLEQLDQEIKDLFLDWKDFCEKLNETQLPRIEGLLDRINKTVYLTDEKDKVCTQIMKRFIQTFETQAREGDLLPNIVKIIKQVATYNLPTVYPKIVYDNDKEYTGGELPVGLLYPNPYHKADPEKLKDTPNDESNLWRQSRFMKYYIACPEDNPHEFQVKMENFQQKTIRWVMGESMIWDIPGGNHLYSAFIGDPPKDLTPLVDTDGYLKERGFSIYVAAHRLPLGAEVLSIALLPDTMASDSHALIHIPNRWGGMELPTAKEMLRYTDGLGLTNQAYIVYGMRLLLEGSQFDLRPSDEKYRGAVNPDFPAYQIYDNLQTADLGDFIPEVLTTYGNMRNTKMSCNLLWGTGFGANRLLADLANDPLNHTPIVLMDPAEDMNSHSHHWSYLSAYMGFSQDGHSAGGISKESIEKATNIYALAAKLPEVPGRKVLILEAPKISFLLSSGIDRWDLWQLMKQKRFDVHVVQPDYQIQEEPAPGLRVYPNLSSIPEAVEWFKHLS